MKAFTTKYPGQLSLGARIRKFQVFWPCRRPVRDTLYAITSSAHSQTR